MKLLDVTLARHDSLVKGREGRELVLGWGEGNMKWEEGTLRAEEWKGEEEQVWEGREEVGDTRGPACLAVIKDLPKLRGSSGYTTTKLSPPH